MNFLLKQKITKHFWVHFLYHGIIVEAHHSVQLLKNGALWEESVFCSDWAQLKTTEKGHFSQPFTSILNLQIHGGYIFSILTFFTNFKTWGTLIVNVKNDMLC